MTARSHLRPSNDPAYVPRADATEDTYRQLGFKCGLEIHQQLATSRKLFCRCPTRRYQSGDDFDAQLVRHMRPTLSELGEYDGTALMEFKTRKNIVYRIKGETACTYDIDDTPPFAINRDALAIAMEIALLLDTSLVGELHITRKQYLDGSIPTGFQRTAIVGIEGEIPIAAHPVRIIQLSLEEDSCREVSDVGHERTYTTDRLGTPLIETVTYPDLRTPAEAAETAQYLRYVARSTGKVNVGIGAARQDVNVSIDGGTRIEIKGVQHIRWIPELTHNEAFRQSALLRIRDELVKRVPDPGTWSSERADLAPEDAPAALELSDDAFVVAVRLPQFGGLLASFTSPGRSFADEISDRLKVIACIEKPNLTTSEDATSPVAAADWATIARRVGASDGDGLLLLWGSADDMPTAIETVDERCRWAFDGVPNETRKAMPDGTTVFERVLPGPDRMYPDTDSAPIPIDDAMIAAARDALPPTPVFEQMARLRAWKVPDDTHAFILRRNLFGTVERLVDDLELDPSFAGTLVGHRLRHVSGDGPVDGERVVRVVDDALRRGLTLDALQALVPAAVVEPDATFDRLLERIGYRSAEPPAVFDALDRLWSELHDEDASPDLVKRRILGSLRPLALGNVPLSGLAAQIDARQARRADASTNEEARR